MYDLYKDYTTALSTIQPNDSLRSVYSATQYVAWEAMNSACQWGIQVSWEMAWHSNL